MESGLLCGPGLSPLLSSAAAVIVDTEDEDSFGYVKEEEVEELEQYSPFENSFATGSPDPSPFDSLYPSSCSSTDSSSFCTGDGDVSSFFVDPIFPPFNMDGIVKEDEVEMKAPIKFETVKDESIPQFNHEIQPSLLHPPSIHCAGLPYEERNVVHTRRFIYARSSRECTVVCWLLRILLSAEFNALPLSSIFDAFQESNPASAAGRHWRQSIRHCLSASQAFVRVLTPDPRKEYLIMNEAGSWWSVHPQWQSDFAATAFRQGPAHRCPPTFTRGLRFRLVEERMERVAPNASDKRPALRPLESVPASSFIFRPVSAHEAGLQPAVRVGGAARPRMARPPFSALGNNRMVRPRHPLTPTARNDEFVIDHEEVVL